MEVKDAPPSGSPDVLIERIKSLTKNPLATRQRLETLKKDAQEWLNNNDSSQLLVALLRACEEAILKRETAKKPSAKRKREESSSSDEGESGDSESGDSESDHGESGDSESDQGESKKTRAGSVKAAAKKHALPKGTQSENPAVPEGKQPAKKQPSAQKPPRAERSKRRQLLEGETSEEKESDEDEENGKSSAGLPAEVEAWKKNLLGPRESDAFLSQVDRNKLSVNVSEEKMQKWHQNRIEVLRRLDESDILLQQENKKWQKFPSIDKAHAHISTCRVLCLPTPNAFTRQVVPAVRPKKLTAVYIFCAGTFMPHELWDTILRSERTLSHFKVLYQARKTRTGYGSKSMEQKNVERKRLRKDSNREPLSNVFLANVPQYSTLSTNMVPHLYSPPVYPSSINVQPPSGKKASYKGLARCLDDFNIKRLKDIGAPLEEKKTKRSRVFQIWELDTALVPPVLKYMIPTKTSFDYSLHRTDTKPLWLTSALATGRHMVQPWKSLASSDVDPDAVTRTVEFRVQGKQPINFECRVGLMQPLRDIPGARLGDTGRATRNLAHLLWPVNKWPSEGLDRAGYLSERGVLDYMSPTMIQADVAQVICRAFGLPLLNLSEWTNYYARLTKSADPAKRVSSNLERILPLVSLARSLPSLRPLCHPTAFVEVLHRDYPPQNTILDTDCKNDVDDLNKVLNNISEQKKNPEQQRPWLVVLADRESPGPVDTKVLGSLPWVGVDAHEARKGSHYWQGALPDSHPRHVVWMRSLDSNRLNTPDIEYIGWMAHLREATHYVPESLLPLLHSEGYEEQDVAEEPGIRDLIWQISHREAVYTMKYKEKRSPIPLTTLTLPDLDSMTMDKKDQQMGW